MNSQELKGRSPYPFETIGVFVASSARLEEVLAEAAYLARIFSARLVLIRIGKQTLKLKTTLEEICERSGINSRDATIIWQEGDPVKTLLEICKKNSVDLLVLETTRRENALRYYLGSIARSMSRNAKCSLLLLTEPKAGGTPFRKIVVSGILNPKTPLTLGTTVYFAEQIGANTISVVTEIDQPALAMATAYSDTADNTSFLKTQLTDNGFKKMHAMVDCCCSDKIKITEEILVGRQGYTIRQYAQNCNADLLVINSPDAKYGIIDRIFTHDMEYILEDLPCNVLIVHSRIS
jgi:nucleotide-binding universal stress UspA family protein